MQYVLAFKSSKYNLKVFFIFFCENSKKKNDILLQFIWKSLEAIEEWYIDQFSNNNIQSTTLICILILQLSKKELKVLKWKISNFYIVI